MQLKFLALLLALSSCAFAQTVGSLNGTVTARQIGPVLMADQFPGADPSVLINACITAVLAAGGGTCDARAFTGAYTMSQQINLGYTNTQTNTLITLLLPNSGIWKWGLTGGTACGIRQFNGTALLGTHFTGNWTDGLRLEMTNTANMDSLYCTDPNSAVYVRAEGFAATNRNSGAVVANGLIHINSTLDESSFSNISASNFYGDAWHIDSPCCATKFDNIQGIVDGNSTNGSTPLTLGNAEAVTISNSTFNNPKYSDYNINILNGEDVTFLNVYMEKQSGATTTPFVYIGSLAKNINFFGGSARANNCAGPGDCGQYAFENHATGGISIKNFGISSYMDGVDDIANKRTWKPDIWSIREYSTEHAPQSTATGGSFIQNFHTDTLTTKLTTPTSSSATCNAGEVAWDASYVYVCIATNTWKLVALSTF